MHTLDGRFVRTHISEISTMLQAQSPVILLNLPTKILNI